MSVYGVMRPALKALWGVMGSDPSAVGTPPFQTAWQDEPRGYTDIFTQARCLLTLMSVTSLGAGVDERIITVDLNRPAGQELQDTFVGERTFVLSARVESEINTDTGTAYEYLERIRQALSFQESIDAMAAVDVYWIEAMPTQDLGPVVSGQRTLSVASMDVLLGWRVTYTNPNRYPYIETADLTLTVDPG